MKTEVLVPNLPESVADATLITWHKQAGDPVLRDENLVDLETDKIVLEVPAPHNGILEQVLQQNGATVTSGDLLAVINTDAAISPADEKPVKEETEKPVQGLSPAVRRLVLEHELESSNIPATGKGGRLTKNDVLDFLKTKTPNLIESVVAIAKPPAPQNFAPPTPVKSDVVSSESRSEQRVPMTRLRVRVAERLIQAQQNSAMLTTFNEVNLSKVIELRREYKDIFLKKHGVKLGFMSFFIKASIEALKRFPVINASVDEHDIIYHGYYDIGIAVSSKRGLVVPILRDADQMDFAGLEKQIAEFGVKAQEGKLSYEDLSGGTFTITNGGVFGSMMSTPILNPPQSAILGMHATQERPCVENGLVVPRPMMYLALSYDHRIIDGKEAVQSLVTIKQCLEEPSRLLLNV